MVGEAQMGDGEDAKHEHIGGSPGKVLQQGRGGVRVDRRQTVCA